jgi:RNA polymerase sigma-70 factor (ECF subfamily)
VPDDLLARARAGEPAGFAALVRLHQAQVYGIALRMLTDSALAQDLSQEVFLQLHRNLASIESTQHLDFWLRRVTAHRAIDRLRQDRRVETTALDAVPELHAMEPEDDPLLRKHLDALIRQLAPMARAVLLLRYQEDLDPLDIANTLAIPVNTVKSHLKRSLSLLRRQLT